MGAPDKDDAPAIAVFLADAAKVPLLNQAQEVVLGRELRERHEEHERLLLGSPLVWRHVLAWGDAVARGDLDAAELMPRGQKPAAAVAAMRRRLAGACRFLRTAGTGGGDWTARAVQRLEALDLNRKKLHALAAEDPAVAALTADVLGRIAAARTSLVEANIRLAVSVAKGFSFSKMDFEDLVQEGSLGLMKAADRFDERLGFKFSTYATWWIRQSIMRAITDKAATIRLPAHVQGLRDKVRALQRRHLERFGREASAAELAHRLGLSAKRLNAVLQSATDPLSLSLEPAGSEDAPLEDVLADLSQPSQLALVEGTLRASEVAEALGKISEREALVLRMRFGIGLSEELTLQQCGERLGITRERVRQIEHRAIKRLKAPRLSGRLKDYWAPG